MNITHSDRCPSQIAYPSYLGKILKQKHVGKEFIRIFPLYNIEWSYIPLSPSLKHIHSTSLLLKNLGPGGMHFERTSYDLTVLLEPKWNDGFWAKTSKVIDYLKTNGILSASLENELQAETSKEGISKKSDNYINSFLSSAYPNSFIDYLSKEFKKLAQEDMDKKIIRVYPFSEKKIQSEASKLSNEEKILRSFPELYKKYKNIELKARNFIPKPKLDNDSFLSDLVPYPNFLMDYLIDQNQTAKLTQENVGESLIRVYPFMGQTREGSDYLGISWDYIPYSTNLKDLYNQIMVLKKISPKGILYFKCNDYTLLEKTYRCLDPLWNDGYWLEASKVFDYVIGNGILSPSPSMLSPYPQPKLSEAEAIKFMKYYQKGEFDKLRCMPYFFPMLRTMDEINLFKSIIQRFLNSLYKNIKG